MAKKQHRKPRRRVQPVVSQEEVDLHVLARALFDHKLETNATNWLTLPWRSGWNAIGLALEVAKSWQLGTSGSQESRWYEAKRWLEVQIDIRSFGPFTYAQADEHLSLLTKRMSSPIRAALRCLQMLIAGSDGAGHNYNHALQIIADSISEAQILLWRGYDALGIDANTTIDHKITTRRNAFNIAWSRGLFHAAYAIKPIR